MKSLLRIHSSITGVLLFIDLDGFKKVNDTEGHEAGDKLLVLVAERLRAALRPGPAVYNIGCREFGTMRPRHSPWSCAPQWLGAGAAR